MSWNLSRQRFLDEIEGLTNAQLRWIPFTGALSIGQMALHVAGVEISFSSQLLGVTLAESELKLKSCATEGVVNDHPFPYQDSDITADSVRKALEVAKSMVEPLIENQAAEILDKQLKSALGPIISGRGAFARFAFHPAYHHGQTYTYKTNPAFPTA
jgi:hypothetical protein